MQYHLSDPSEECLTLNNLLTEFILFKYIFSSIILLITKTSYVVQSDTGGIRRIVPLFEASNRYVCLNNLAPWSHHATVLLIVLEAFDKNWWVVYTGLMGRCLKCLATGVALKVVKSTKVLW